MWRGCKTCKITKCGGGIKHQFLSKKKVLKLKMTVRKIIIRFCNNIRHLSNEINKRGGGIFFCGGWNFSKSVSMGPTFIREMRVCIFEKKREISQ